MAKYRQIHTEFWSDGFVLDLTPEEKYFYLYLMSNSKTSQCGIYELPKRVIEMETGYNRETIDKLLKRFEEYEKISYCDATKELMIINWIKYNVPNNCNAIKCVNKELKGIKNTKFILMFYNKCVNYDLNIKDIFKGIEVNIQSEDVNVENKSFVKILEGACKGLTSNEVINNKQKVISNKEEAEVINSEDNKIKGTSTTLEDVFIFFEKNIYKPKDMEYKKIINWVNNLNCDVIILAIEEAINYNVKTIKYIENILYSWEEKGLRTVEDVIRYKKSWNEKKTKKNNGSSWNYGEQRQYDFDKLEEKLLG